MYLSILWKSRFVLRNCLTSAIHSIFDIPYSEPICHQNNTFRNKTIETRCDAQYQISTIILLLVFLSSSIISLLLCLSHFRTDIHLICFLSLEGTWVYFALVILHLVLVISYHFSTLYSLDGFPCCYQIVRFEFHKFL